MNIAVMYELGLSVHKIGALIGRSGKWVWKCLVRQGVGLRKPGPCSAFVNEAYFDVIGSPVCAYWLGVLLADGYVIRSHGYSARIGLGVASCDVGWLECFRTSLDYSGNICWQPDGSVRVEIHSEVLAVALAKFGVVERKSLVVKPPSLNAYQSHFWRGVFDGDGSISLSGMKDYPQPCLRICGTRAVCEGFFDFLESEGISRRKVFKSVRAKDTLWVAQVQGKDALKVVEILYMDASMYLERKKQYCDMLVQSNNL